MSALNVVLAQANSAYEGGQMVGVAIRWIALAAFGFVLVRRAVTGNYGKGFRQSQLGTALGITLVAGLMFASVVYDFGRATARPEMPANAGFVGGVDQAPVAGQWSATGVYTMSRGYAGGAGRTIERPWQIDESCVSSRCEYTLTRGREGFPPQIAPLVRHDDGWHASFPPEQLSCRATGTEPVMWELTAKVVLRFTDGGRNAEGRESRLSYSPACGQGRATVEWSAAIR